jgi:Family of unknown function (DUF5681)
MGNVKRRRPRVKTDDYKVGYSNPPRHSQWEPGQSGNPKGRPKGTRNFKTDVQATLRAPVMVAREGKPRKISSQEAMLLRLRAKALNGDLRALDLGFQLARAYNNDDLAASVSFASEDENVLRIYQERVLSGAARTPSDSIDKTDSSSPTSAPSAAAGQDSAKLKTQIQRYRPSRDKNDSEK